MTCWSVLPCGLPMTLNFCLDGTGGMGVMFETGISMEYSAPCEARSSRCEALFFEAMFPQAWQFVCRLRSYFGL